MGASRLSTSRPRRLSRYVIASWLFAGLMAGCSGSGDSPTELTPEAKKTLDANKVGPPNKFVKQKPAAGKPK